MMAELVVLVTMTSTKVVDGINFQESVSRFFALQESIGDEADLGKKQGMWSAGD